MEQGVVPQSCFTYAGQAEGQQCSKIEQGQCPSGGKATLYKVKSGSVVTPSTESEIMEEIYKNGPVEAAFEVYQVNPPLLVVYVSLSTTTGFLQLQEWYLHAPVRRFGWRTRHQDCRLG